MLGRREPRHTRDPFLLPYVVTVLAQQVEIAGPLVTLEDLSRSVVRAIVRRDDEVDAGVKVERDLGLDDVRLVPGEQGHHEPHAGPVRCRERRSASKPPAASRMNAGATGIEYSAAAGTASEVPAITSSAAQLSTTGVASPRGRRIAHATRPSASQNDRTREPARRPVQPGSEISVSVAIGELLVELCDATVEPIEVRRVAGVVGEDRMLGRRGPHLAESSVRRRDEARDARRRDRLPLARHGQARGHVSARGRRGRGLARLVGADGQEHRPPQEPQGVACDASGERPGMLEHGLPADARQVRIVVVPAPGSVREPGQVLVHARAPRREELVDVDSVRTVGLSRQEVARDLARELAGRLAVFGIDDPVLDVCTEQRNRVAATAHDREVVRPHGVVGRPPEERHEQCRGDNPRSAETDAPRAGQQEDGRQQHDQDLTNRPHEHEERDAETQRCAATVGRLLDEPCGEQRRKRERRREERVAGKPMEEQGIAREHEQDERDGDADSRAEASCDTPPAEDRQRVEERHRGFRSPRPRRQDGLREDTRDRRPAQHRLREDDLARPELERRAEIRPQVSSRCERKRYGDERIHEESEDEERRRGPPVALEALQAAPGATDPVGHERGPRPATIASTVRSAARPSTSPTTSRTTRRRASASSSGSASARSTPATTSSKLSAGWNAPDAASSS